MNNDQNNKRSTEICGVVGKPAVMRRPLLQVVREWFTGRVAWVPFCPGHSDCPVLKVGDTLIAITDNESYNLIAMGMKLNPTTPTGSVRKWKVKEVWGPQDALIISQGGARTLTKYLPWEDGNGVACKPHILHTRMFIRFYHEQRLSTVA